MMDTARILSHWQRLNRIPGGNRLFSRLFGLFVPYSGTIGAVLEQLEPGHSRLSLVDKRRVRNHLDSVHAMALANFGELATGLALLTAIPADSRGILTGYSIRYTKKARGRLRAECRAPGIKTSEKQTVQVQAAITDDAGEAVAHVTAEWLVGPKRK